MLSTMFPELEVVTVYGRSGYSSLSFNSLSPTAMRPTHREWSCICLAHSNHLSFRHISLSRRLSSLRVDLLPPRCYSPKQATYKDGTPQSLPSINIRSRRFRTNKYQLIMPAVDTRLEIIYVFLFFGNRVL